MPVLSSLCPPCLLNSLTLHYYIDDALKQYGIELYMDALHSCIGNDGLHIGLYIYNELEIQLRRGVQPHGVTSVFYFVMTMEWTEGSSV